MKCELCSTGRNVYDFNNECCWVRWLRIAYKPHANAMLDRYQMQMQRKVGEEKAKQFRKRLIELAKGDGNGELFE